MNDYSKTPLVELITNMTYLDKEIEMEIYRLNNKIKQYEEMRQEVITRFPPVEKEECFKQKKLIKGFKAD